MEVPLEHARVQGAASQPASPLQGVQPSTLGASGRRPRSWPGARLCPQARPGWVVPNGALGSLGLEQSQGSPARSAPVSGHPSPSKSLNSPSPSGKWEGSLPPGRGGRGGALSAGLLQRKARGGARGHPRRRGGGVGAGSLGPYPGAEHALPRALRIRGADQARPACTRPSAARVARVARAASGGASGAAGRAGGRPGGRAAGAGRTPRAGARDARGGPCGALPLPLPRGPEREP